LTFISDAYSVLSDNKDVFAGLQKRLFFCTALLKVKEIAMKDSSVLTQKETPIDFKSLPFEAQKQHFLSVAKRALPLWDYPDDSTLSLLNITENATYRVESPHKKTIVMRVHRLDYAEKDSIKTELSWILDLGANTKVNVVTPLRARDGEFVQTIETPNMAERRHVVCFDFVKGKAPKDSHDDNESIGNVTETLGKIPKWITLPTFRAMAVAYDRLGEFSANRDSLTSDDKNLYRTLGSIMAAIHVQSKKWTPPDFFERIEWDWNATFGEGWNNYYGMHYCDLKGTLSASDIKASDTCVALMKMRVEAYGKYSDRYGMIHSDLRAANLLRDENKITVLDFDDCGKGWFMYDIACIVGFMEHRPDLKKLIGLILEGYRKISAVSEEDEQEIETFIMMRRIGLLQAIMYHINNTATGSGESAELSPEIMAFYAKGTAILARKYTRKYKALPLPSTARETKENSLCKDRSISMAHKGVYA
jgi:Ser/Thr protein kinase RdoA (MazF antagonist)